MRKKLIALCILAILLPGCWAQEDPYRVDTVIYIPVDPTDPTEETAAETAKPTEAEETQPTEQTVPETTGPAKKPTGGSAKPSGSKGSSSGSSSSAKQTEPPETTAPTQPPVTEPTEPEDTLYDISGYAVGALEQQIAERINQYRVEAGLSPLTFDSYLCAVASARGYEASSYWSHSRPDGRHFSTVLGDYGYGASVADELLVHGSGDAAAIVDMWMNSESHRNILMSPSYTTVGVGVYSGTSWVICCLVTG